MPCFGKKDYRAIINVEAAAGAAETLLADDPIIRAVNRKSNGSLALAYQISLSLESATDRRFSFPLNSEKVKKA